MLKQPKKQKKPNYKARAGVYKALGYSSVGIATMSGFIVYESIIDWSNFKQELENFVVVAQDTVKLNLAIAFPLLIAIVIFLSVTLRKNKEFFKDKVSVSLLLAIVILYMVYSVIEVSMASLIGAFAGSVVDEFVFSPLSRRAKAKAVDQHDIDIEYRKEANRIMARKKAEEELNGTV